MIKALSVLKMTFWCEVIGIICNFIAFFVPLGQSIKMGLFVFGNVLILASIVEIFRSVYKPLKDDELK